MAAARDAATLSRPSCRYGLDNNRARAQAGLRPKHSLCRGHQHGSTHRSLVMCSKLLLLSKVGTHSSEQLELLVERLALLLSSI